VGPCLQTAAASNSRSSPKQALTLGPQPSVGGFLLPARSPSRTAGNMGAAAAGDAVLLASAGGFGGIVGIGSAGGSPLRPGSRGNSFTAGSGTPRGRLWGTSSRLGLSVQVEGAENMGGGSSSALPSPKI
jgi:hypothetical protein